MCYNYDSLSRVISRTVKNPDDDSVIFTETFSYDAAGNVTNAPNSYFTYDTNNRLVVFNGNTVSYDLDGNMLSNGVQSFTYDWKNRLLTAGGHTYTYNVENVRIRNLCEDEDTTYTYDNNAKLNRLLCKTTNGVTTKYVYGRGLIGEEIGNAFKTYHFDSRGSTVAITDASGNVTDTFAYDTYGKLLSRTGTSKVIFGYNGRDGVVTDDNGLIYMRARYYSPEMKRFVNADIVAGAISNAVTLNRYAYANGNPVSFVDPFGLWSLKGAWNSFTNWVSDTANDVGDWVVDTYNTAKDAVVDTYNEVKDWAVDTYNDVKDWAVDTFNEAKETVNNTVEWVDNNVIKPAGEFLSTAGRKIKNGCTTVANAISDNVGAQVSVGKEKSFPPEYYIWATVEEGRGYSKEFGNEKPINFFASAGEHWWEFWEWSVGFDVNINGYGGGVSLGTEASINVHAGNMSHEVGSNALGRISHKVVYNVEDAYSYKKYSLNGPEIAGTVAALYYGGPAVVKALKALWAVLGGAAPVTAH